MHLLCARHNVRLWDTSGNDLFGEEADLARSLFGRKQRSVRCLVWAPWVLFLEICSASLTLNLQECGVSSWIKNTFGPFELSVQACAPNPEASHSLPFHRVYFCFVRFTEKLQVEASSVPGAEQGKGSPRAHWWNRQYRGRGRRGGQG